MIHAFATQVTGLFTLLVALSVAGQSEAAATYGNLQDRLSLELGVRGVFVMSGGLDPFLEQEFNPEGALVMSGALLSDGAFTLAGVGGFNWGKNSAEARGLDATLNLHRIWVAPEFRYYPAGSFYVFARIAPSASFAAATLEAGDQLQLVDSQWLWGFDAGVGGAVGLLPARTDRAFQFWVVADLGYSVSTSRALLLEPRNGPIRAEPVEFPSMDLSGMFLGVRLAATAF